MLEYAIREEALECVEVPQISAGPIIGVSAVFVHLFDGNAGGVGEGCPVPFLGEPMGLAEQEIRKALMAAGPELSPICLLQHMRPGPGRNALDCAVWDLEAKQTGVPIWTIADVRPLDRLAVREQYPCFHPTRWRSRPRRGRTTHC